MKMVIILKKELIEKIINICLEYGADFSEVYYEKSKSMNYIYVGQKLDDIISSNQEGVGIRVSKDGNVYYTSTNELNENNLIALTKKLLSNFSQLEKKHQKIALKDLETIKIPIEIEHQDYPFSKKLALLREIDIMARNYSPFINQVKAGLSETDKNFIVANSYGKYIESNEITTRVFANILGKNKDKNSGKYTSFGAGAGYECLKNFDIKKFLIPTCEAVVNKLEAKNFKGGEVPVVLGPGFGAVIFHEACGHALEATSVADKVSVFSDKLHERIASDKVTLIDDGTIPGEWGTTLIDSEGNKTQKNILIKDGILTSFLVDNLNSEKMKHPSTGSGRRQNYKYPPTSRMNNTYLEKGTDKFSDMIKSIDYGLYCKAMNGGSVDTKTGDFNFMTSECYLIENGKIGPMVKDVSLIGKGQDILKEVEMVSDDLVLETGYCGSRSGTIPVTIGEPTIKVRNILVGGNEE